MQSQEICVLTVTILLCLVPVQTGMSLQQTNRVITSSGIINYPEYKTIYVGFENPEDFETPEDPATGYVWASQDSWYSMREFTDPDDPDNQDLGMYFEPATDFVHSGIQSARLALENPIDNDRRRVHIYHCWETATFEHLWFEAWWYFPVDLVVDNHISFHTTSSERWYYPPSGRYMTYSTGLAIEVNTKVAEGEYKLQVIRNWGYVDNDHDGENDLPPVDYWDDWIRTPGTIKFGEWFKITTYLYRNLTDYDNGRYKLWINDELQWDMPWRTIGIDPYAIDTLPKTGGGERGWVCSGVSIYESAGSSPIEIRVDDVILKFV